MTHVCQQPEAVAHPDGNHHLVREVRCLDEDCRREIASGSVCR